MSYGLQATGGSFWDTNSTYNQPVYEETIATDIATQSQDVTRTANNDGWTDFFKNTISSVFDYAIKKDAVVTGAQVQKTLQTPAPSFYPVGSIQQTPATAQIVPGVSNTLLMIGVAVVAYLTLKK